MPLSGKKPDGIMANILLPSNVAFTEKYKCTNAIFQIFTMYWAPNLVKIVDDEKFINATFFVNANLAVLSLALPFANARPCAADKGLSVSVDIRLFITSLLLTFPDKSVFSERMFFYFL